MTATLYTTRPFRGFKCPRHITPRQIGHVVLVDYLVDANSLLPGESYQARMRIVFGRIERQHLRCQVQPCNVATAIQSLYRYRLLRIAVPGYELSLIYSCRQ